MGIRKTGSGIHIVGRSKPLPSPVTSVAVPVRSEPVAGPGEKLFLTVGIASALSFIMLAEQGDPEWNEKYGRYVLEELPRGGTEELLRQHPEFATLGKDVKRWLDSGLHASQIVEKLERKFGHSVIVKMQ